MPGAVGGIPVACRCEALCRGHPREWDPTGSYKPLGPALGREDRRISLVGAVTGISCPVRREPSPRFSLADCPWTVESVQPWVARISCGLTW